ncbi:hypothetical protein MBLNU230_g4544t1 [Neophaeotheca triangularis]
MAPKKKQQEKMNLGTFLADQSLGSWADEMDSQPLPSAPSSGYSSMNRDGGGERRGFGTGAWERSASGTGDRAGSGYARTEGYARQERQELPLPSKPPYTAHLGNLAFDVSSGDIESFLGECQVTNVRIVEDKLDHKPKGFGYVEFATLDGLKKALTLTETNFMGRNIRISVADPPKDRGGDSNRDFSDWSRKGPLPDLPQNSRRPSDRGAGFGAARGMDNASDAGGEREGGDRRRPGFFENDNKVRDFGNWERKGPLTPAPGAAPPMRDGGRLKEGGPPMERRASPAWGEGRSEAGSRPPRREFVERPAPERAPTAAEQDSQWRSKMRPDPEPAATPEVSTPTSPAAPAAPKERPRLNLAKRTVSTADPSAPPATAEATESSSKASPFGAARPVDTATKEKEMAEKREQAAKQKAEADAKAREEKAAKDAAARADRADRADKGQGDETVKSPTTETAPPTGPRRPSRQQQQQNSNKNPKENVDQQQREKPSFSILQRDAGGDEHDEAPSGADAENDANGAIVGDKETKPQEVVREVPKDGSGATAEETTAEAMDEDGWSTVAAKPKTGRRGGGAGGARALAS